MKILFLTDDFPPLSFGGAGRVVFELARKLKEQGHDIYIVTSTREKKALSRVSYQGLEVFHIYSDYPEWLRGYMSLYNPQTVGRVKEIIKNIDPDVVHAHNIHFYLSYHCLKIAKQQGARTILTAHDAMLFHYGKMYEKSVSALSLLRRYRFRYNPLRNLIISYYLRFADKIVAVSQALKNALIKNGIENVEVIYNGVDVDRWSGDDGKVGEIIERYGLANKKVILFGGRLSALKGGLKILEAMEIIVGQVENATLVVCGKKDGFALEMERFAEKKGIGEKIKFTGWLSGDQLRMINNIADIVVAPSLYLDPLPTVILEAMACRKPVVGTCFGGTQEMVEDGKTGYVVNPYDIKMFADKIINLLKNPKLAHELGQKGYERAQQKFNLDLQCKEYLKLYERS